MSYKQQTDWNNFVTANLVYLFISLSNHTRKTGTINFGNY